MALIDGGIAGVVEVSGEREETVTDEFILEKGRNKK